MKKALFIFTGGGYNADRPLLYYTRKLCINKGFDVFVSSYSLMGMKPHDDSSIDDSIEKGLEAVKESFADTDFSKYEKLYFASKSVGTVIAVRFASYKKLCVSHILFTPLEQTFTAIEDYRRNSLEEKDFSKSCIAFSGTKDPWIDAKVTKSLCKKLHIPLVKVKGANHSLESGKMMKDIKTLKAVMKKVERFIR